MEKFSIFNFFSSTYFNVRSTQDLPVRGLYPKAALMAHDCIGNTFITMDKHKELKVYASVDIKCGDIIYYNYTDPLMVSQCDHWVIIIYSHVFCHPFFLSFILDRIRPIVKIISTTANTFVVAAYDAAIQPNSAPTWARSNVNYARTVCLYP